MENTKTSRIAACVLTDVLTPGRSSQAKAQVASANGNNQQWQREEALDQATPIVISESGTVS